MNNFLLKTKKVLSICMETTAGGRNYSGGLGALYGDFTRTMYRRNADFIAVTPIYKYGYVQQRVTDDGVIDSYIEQDFNENYEETGIEFYIPMVFRDIKVRVWKNKNIRNAYGLDSYLPENGEFAAITNNLYGENGFDCYDGDSQRLMQEVILGVGSIKLADALGFDFDIVHLNEGHGAFASLYMLSELKKHFGSFEKAWDKVKSMTVFTTHTPIAAGNKSRPIEMIIGLDCNLGLSYDELKAIGGDENGYKFASTTAALRLSKQANAVAFRHQFTSQNLWGNISGACNINYVDNAVDLVYWQDPEIKEAYENGDYAGIRKAHTKNKKNLIEFVKKQTGISLDDSALTLGFGRRFIGYKQADAILVDEDRFNELVKNHNIQIVYAGKTHPKDLASKDILMRVYEMSKKYPENVVFLQNYDVNIAGFMTKGSDAWLNTPENTQEASGTSGMKGAANGVPSVSTYDGWFYRSGRHGVNGWIVGNEHFIDKRTVAQNLYNVLENEVLPTFYDENSWNEIMMAAITTAVTDCSMDRFVEEYYSYLYNVPYLSKK